MDVHIVTANIACFENGLFTVRLTVHVRTVIHVKRDCTHYSSVACATTQCAVLWFYFRGCEWRSLLLDVLHALVLHMKG